MRPAFVYAETDGEPHNTITPIARRRGDAYELDLVLRNNITTEEHPLGVYHPHANLHHIKKENIGLIEVMGLAVLPARLKDEMADLEQAILDGADIRADEKLAKHADWVEEFLPKYGFTAGSGLEGETHRRGCMRSFRQRSVWYLRRFSPTQESTSARKRAEQPSCALWIR